MSLQTLKPSDYGDEATLFIGNSFRSEGGSGSDPKEYSATALVKTGFNFSTDLFYGSLAYQAERDKSSAQFYVGYRF